ncbi:MAG: hypothetical protein RLY31_1571 [Bacteroidota bacterium]
MDTLTTDTMPLLDTFLAQWQSQTILDWSILVTALGYIWLAALGNRWCWPWGIVSCSIWAYADFFRYQLWADGILQLFYVGMGCWGFLTWKETAGPTGLQVRSWRWKRHVPVLLAGGMLSLLLGYLFERFTPTALPYPDSFITAFSILATYLTIRRVLENWIYWMLLDTAAAVLFLSRDALLAAVVMAVYTAVSFFGYRNWRRQQMAAPTGGSTL